MHMSKKDLSSDELDTLRRSKNSNKGTGGMESSVVLFKPRIHLFACTHPSVSISFVCNDWLAYKDHSTALYQTGLDYSPCCLQASSSPYVSNTFGMWIFVCVSLSAYTHQSPACVSMRLDCGSLSVHPSPALFKHV